MDSKQTRGVLFSIVFSLAKYQTKQLLKLLANRVDPNLGKTDFFLHLKSADATARNGEVVVHEFDIFHSILKKNKLLCMLLTLN